MLIFFALVVSAMQVLGGGKEDLFKKKKKKDKIVLSGRQKFCVIFLWLYSLVMFQQASHATLAAHTLLPASWLYLLKIAD